jgi:hypothetical protein
MGLLDPTPTPYDPLVWQRAPMADRGRMVCEAWAMQGYGTPPGVFALYALKVALYVGGWMFFCSFSAPLGKLSAVGTWWLHPIAFEKAIVSPPVAVFLVTMLIALPLLGNLFPDRLSFLLAMRYYAGNWAYSVWLFRGESYRKLERLTTSSRWVYDQLASFYDRSTAVGLVGKVMGFRLMHLHGRALPLLVPKAVERLEDYEWVDGEIVAGLALGWNFGEGHLHNEQLLESIQAQCRFEPGELRCIFVESQPLGRRSLAYRIVDACAGEIERGSLPTAELRTRQPWSDGASALTTRG